MALNNIHIIFNPSTGKMQQLQVNASGGNKTYNNFEEGKHIDGDEPSEGVLWEGAHSLRLVTGSNCVVIAGRKFCA